MMACPLCNKPLDPDGEGTTELYVWSDSDTATADDNTPVLVHEACVAGILLRVKKEAKLADAG